MKCPYCSSKSSVTNSRTKAKGIETWRRRYCSKCNQIWTTAEILDFTSTHRVEASNGHLEPFIRDRIFVSILNALNHRKTPIKDSTYVTSTIVNAIILLNRPVIKKGEIISTVLKVLKRYDGVAYAVYKAQHE